MLILIHNYEVSWEQDPTKVQNTYYFMFMLQENTDVINSIKLLYKHKDSKRILDPGVNIGGSYLVKVCI